MYCTRGPGGASGETLLALARAGGRLRVGRMHKHGHTGGCCGGHHPQDAGAAHEAALAALKSAGLRLTAPRSAMLLALARARGPMPVEDIRRASGEDADLVTVYRSMEALEKIGLVRRHVLESGKSLYELCDPRRPGEHHHHVICRVCGRMSPLPGCRAEVFENAARELGYGELTHVLEVYGVCPDCARGSRAKPVS